MNSDPRMSPLSCAEVQDLAPEAGLGILNGLERARVLAHLEACPACAGLVEDTAHAADTLLTLAPQIDPPAGFDARLLARQRPLPARRRPTRRWALGGVVAASTAAALAVVVGVGGGGQSGFRVQHPAAVAALGGRAIEAAPLQHNGQEVGQVFVYAGRPSWMFMTVDIDGPPKTVTCEAQTATGDTIALGTFTTSTSYWSWGSRVNIAPNSIRTVRLVDSNGATVATATL